MAAETDCDVRSRRNQVRLREFVGWRATLREAGKTGRSSDLYSLMEPDSCLMEAVRPE